MRFMVTSPRQDNMHLTQPTAAVASCSRVYFEIEGKVKG
jgi:hypothetical protein